jgi:hypothetical protein
MFHDSSGRVALASQEPLRVVVQRTLPSACAVGGGSALVSATPHSASAGNAHVEGTHFPALILSKDATSVRRERRQEGDVWCERQHAGE